MGLETIGTVSHERYHTIISFNFFPPSLSLPAEWPGQFQPLTRTPVKLSLSHPFQPSKVLQSVVYDYIICLRATIIAHCASVPSMFRVEKEHVISGRKIFLTLFCSSHPRTLQVPMQKWYRGWILLVFIYIYFFLM